MRLSYFKNAGGSAEVLEENNFYPFGLKHEGYNQVAGNLSYNYEYNGKELQKETGWSDFGARMYMADIGRWGVVDPLAESTTRVNPYNYALNNPVMFIDPDGRKPMASTEMDENSVGFGNGRGMLSYLGRGDSQSIMSFLGRDDEFMKSRVDGLGGGGGSATLVNIIINFIRGDEQNLGNFVNSDFEDNGWHVIDASSLADALMKLTKYLGNNQADNIYINAHGLVGKRYTLNENGEALRNPQTGEYILTDDTGFYTNIETEKIYGTDIQQYIADSGKLTADKKSSIDSLAGIGNYVRDGKNLIIGACFSANDTLFGTGLSSLVKSRDIFANRDFSSLFPIGGKIRFQDFIGFNQTSQKRYEHGWVWYKDGVATQTNFNIIMTKYGVKTIK